MVLFPSPEALTMAVARFSGAANVTSESAREMRL